MPDGASSRQGTYGRIAITAFAWGLALPVVGFREFLHPKYVTWVVGIAVVVTVAAVGVEIIRWHQSAENEVTA